MELTRYSTYPILLPDTTSDWETYNVFNPAVVYHNHLWHMLYRAQGLDWISRIGYAVSADGIQWNRLRRPVLEPHDMTDSRGIEDPRVVEIDGVFYMTYTAYGSSVPIDVKPTHSGGGIQPMIARSSNLITWERLGPIVTGEDNKDHVLFPRQIKGKFAALHRRHPKVWLAYSEDMLHWKEQDMAPIYGPRAESAWDSQSVGNNGVPIETSAGWLVLNHGYTPEHIYRIGAVLLDLEDPTRVIRRPADPIFEPRELWELRGDVPNVVFSCANPVLDGTVYVYYGGADHVIGLATCALSDLLDYVLTAR
ncbi:predicted glycosylase [Longilinea arvoryzae]|uniref:Predicted glycosylase n=1 Tax=Longilinea arvoryzae TaxID=360412 RepID=A0A0S7BGR7_9CHLR|nr:glycosidase [Longilinea arvoryzae]GAP14336.1 predicted glycosylase [Longilinea arvoryzae]